jgi:hypothetical protein
MARKGGGKVRHIEARPLSEGRPTLPPDAGGNRQQRRTAGKLERQGRTVEARPADVDELLKRIGQMHDWRTVNARELGRRLGLHPNKARGIRQILLDQE